MLKWSVKISQRHTEVRIALALLCGEKEATFRREQKLSKGKKYRTTTRLTFAQV